ncbi:hypothetical protein F5888DRAFT_1113768 [Russula emetica]|nr:hypothetical protein F5888DRAFT_1113768 [Russula emetica]
MATSLSALTSLESLHLTFRYPRPRPALGRRRLPPPPLTRYILPSLTKIRFKGASEYLVELWARIDAPRLDELHITFCQSNHIRHTTTLPVHQSKTSAEGTGKGPYRISFLRPLLSISHHRHLTTSTMYSACKSHARRQNGSFHPLSRSAPHPCLPFPRWKTSTSSKIEELTMLARRCRKYAMAGTFTSVYCCEESLPMREICTTYCTRPARTCRGQNDRSVAHPGECFLGGSSAVGTSPRRHRKVCCRATGHQLSCSSFPLGHGSGTV